MRSHVNVYRWSGPRSLEQAARMAIRLADAGLSPHLTLTIDCSMLLSLPEHEMPRFRTLQRDDPETFGRC